MRLAHPHPHRSAELTLVALVDVLLLLVMFFILAGTFDRPRLVELLSGGGGKPTAAPPASVLVRLHPDGSADLNGERLPTPSWRAASPPARTSASSSARHPRPCSATSSPCSTRWPPPACATSASSKPMRLVADRPPRGILKGFPLVPLASVVLLLLLTLMLTAAVEPHEPLVVVPPSAATAEPAEALPGTILVDRDGRLARDGSVIGLEALGTALAAEKRLDVRLRADRALSIGTLLTIRERLAAAGVRRLELVVARP